MKKKLLTLMVSGALILGNVSGAMAAEKNGCGAAAGISGSLQTVLEQYLTKCFDWKVPQKPGAAETPGDSESSEAPEKPENSDRPGSSGTESQKPQQNAGNRAEQVVSLVNQQRQNAGLSGLKSDNELMRLAQLKAEDMAQKGYFSHTSPTYGSAFDMLKSAGYSYRTAGENIAMGQKTAETVMNGWMNSSGHRANILGSGYTKIGVGYAVNSKGTPYWVQIFAG